MEDSHVLEKVTVLFRISKFASRTDCQQNLSWNFVIGLHSQPCANNEAEPTNMRTDAIGPVSLHLPYTVTPEGKTSEASSASSKSPDLPA
jgi:hypothetical protein